MRCPKCSFMQADDRAECKNCGVIFEKLKENGFSSHLRPPKSSPAPGFKYLMLPVALIAAAGLALNMGGSTDHTAESSFPVAVEPEISNFKRQHAANSELTRICERSMAESGATELEIRATCHDDPEAWKKLREGQEQYVAALNQIPADEVSRIDVHLIPQTTAAVDDRITLEIYGIFRDTDGNPASSEGELSIEVDNRDGNSSEYVQQIHQNHFRSEPLPGSVEPTVWGLFDYLYFSRSDMQGKEVKVRLRFGNSSGQTSFRF